MLVFLIGFMCSGKTTLGQALAREVGSAVNFIDLDDFIEAREGCSIRQIFDSRGEDAFRSLERESLMHLVHEHAHTDAATDCTIVACGGGTPCFFDNIEVMNRAGTTVWLRPSQERLHTRLLQGRAKRPLLAGMDDDAVIAYANSLEQKRLQHYTKAAHRFDSSLLENDDEVSQTARCFISRFIPLPTK